MNKSDVISTILVHLCKKQKINTLFNIISNFRWQKLKIIFKIDLYALFKDLAIDTNLKPQL